MKNPRQIALHVGAGNKEVREHTDAPDQTGNGFNAVALRRRRSCGRTDARGLVSQELELFSECSRGPMNMERNAHGRKYFLQSGKNSTGEVLTVAARSGVTNRHPGKPPVAARCGVTNRRHGCKPACDAPPRSCAPTRNSSGR